MYRMFVSVTVFLGLLVLSGGVTSAALPFERHGTINHINAHQGVLVINDVTYIVLNTTRVYVFAGKAKQAQEQSKAQSKEAEKAPAYGNASLLREGMHIGYRVEDEGPGRKGRIVEAWILPPGTIPRSRE
jgi:hypothetical protein